MCHKILRMRVFVLMSHTSDFSLQQLVTPKNLRYSPLDGAAKSTTRPLAVVCGTFEVARWCKRRAPKLHPQTHTPVSASLH